MDSAGILAQGTPPPLPPYQVSSQSEKNYTWESANGLSTSESLISSLSIRLMSYASHERTRPTS